MCRVYAAFPGVGTACATFGNFRPKLLYFHGKTCPVQEEHMECNYSTGMIYWIPRDMRWVCGIAAPSASAFAESS